MAPFLAWRLGRAAIVILTAGTLLVGLCISLLIFLWGADDNNRIWHATVVNNRLITSVTALAEILRFVVNIQLGVAAAMMAAIALERQDVLLSETAPCLAIRSKYDWQNIALLLWSSSPWKRGKAGIKPSGLTVVTAVLLLVACIVQFSSVILVGDIGPGQVYVAYYPSLPNSTPVASSQPLLTSFIPLRTRGLALISSMVLIHLVALSGVTLLFLRACKLTALGSPWQALAHGSRGEATRVLFSTSPCVSSWPSHLRSDPRSRSSSLSSQDSSDQCPECGVDLDGGVGGKRKVGAGAKKEGVAGGDGAELVRHADVTDTLAKTDRAALRVGVARADRDGRVAICLAPDDADRERLRQTRRRTAFSRFFVAGDPPVSAAAAAAAAAPGTGIGVHLKGYGIRRMTPIELEAGLR